MRDFDLREHKFKRSKVHLILAGLEHEEVYADQLRAWESFDPSARASLVHLEHSSHAVPDSEPSAASRLTLAVLSRQQSMIEGRMYRVNGNKTNECKTLRDLKADTCD